MSIKIMSLVWENFKRGGSEKLTMLALADWCNDDGLSLHPSINGIAKKVCVSEKQARRIVHGFIHEGYLSVIGNHNGGNPGQSRQYKLNVAMLETTPAGVTPPKNVTPPMGVQDPSHGGASPLPPMGVEPPLSVNNPSVGEEIISSQRAQSSSVIYKQRAGDWKKSEDIPSTKPEEPKKPKQAKKTSPLTEIPIPFEITEQMFEFAESHGLSDEETIFQTTRFKNYHLSKGTKFRRWDLTWQNWITGRFLKQGGSR